MYGSPCRLIQASARLFDPFIKHSKYLAFKRLKQMVDKLSLFSQYANILLYQTAQSLEKTPFTKVTESIHKIITFYPSVNCPLNRSVSNSNQYQILISTITSVSYPILEENTSQETISGNYSNLICLLSGYFHNFQAGKTFNKAKGVPTSIKLRLKLLIEEALSHID